MKNQKGITLVALVVTIIVLLILAGISIAMLTGENGIIANAQRAATANAYYGAEEQVKLAYMAVRTEIMAQTVKDGTYNPSTAVNTEALAAIVSKDLNTSAWSVDGSTPGIIQITYTDTAIDAGVLGSRTWTQTTYPGTTATQTPITVNPAPRYEGHVNYTITLYDIQTATLEIDIEDGGAPAPVNPWSEG